jgi:SagB-type dehydrogenase family enzyme
MKDSVRLDYRFNADVTSIERKDQRITLNVTSWRPLSFTPRTTALADAVMALAAPGAALSHLVTIAAAGGEVAAAEAAIDYYVERFTRGRLLAWTIADDAGELARIDALASRWRPRTDPLPPGDLDLCRFAYLRRNDTGVAPGVVLESGLERARVLLGSRGLADLAELLARPRPATPGSFAEVLWRLGFLDLAQPVESEARRCWEFHDLLAHEAGRNNRDGVPIGGTYRFAGKFPPAPAIKPTPPGERIALAPVDPERIRQRSDSLDAVQMRRRSIRRFASAAIPLAMLTEFLWRVCRTTGHEEGEYQELISRPYPAGGSVNELEFYLAVRRCAGLESALYHYDSHGHSLVRLAASEAVAGRIVDHSAAAMALGEAGEKPDITIVIASRLPRLAWKYQGMAYRASLMNAGVVFNLMYLVATDMGLAPCANGTGDSRLLEEATGLDRFTETAIAEFALALPAD